MKVKVGFSLGMSGPPTAGFDPIFCIHHSNIDRLWAEWSCMAGKEWGYFPSQEWFDEKAWFFFDVVTDNGKLEALETNNPRKQYFDYRALGIAFKYEDHSKTPLALPDPIPQAPPPSAMGRKTSHIATIASPLRVSGLGAERVATSSVGEWLKAPFAAVKSHDVSVALGRRILMRINGVNLKDVRATGFDVHLAPASTAVPKRTDSSFVGSIALFRHKGHIHNASGLHGGHGEPAMGENLSDTFDVTQALIAAGQTDPSKLYVVIVPISLSATVDGQKEIVEMSALGFDSIEFFSNQ